MKLTRRPPAILKQEWKFLSVSCNHGDLVDPVAVEAVLEFKSRWKPDAVVCLGDCFDTRCFRTGAKGGKDEAAKVGPDLNSGIEFLKKLRPTHFLCGNHEDRLWGLRDHYNAQISALATMLVERIETQLAVIGCKVVVPYDYKAHIMLGNMVFTHGTLFGTNASRDTAETWGKPVCHGHTHRAAIGYGRMYDNPMGICTGHLMDIKKATYAKNAKSTMGWSQGFAWGVYNDTRTVAWLHSQPQNETKWVLPL